VTRVVLAGGGLANSLIAWRLAALRPDVELCVVERGPTLGGNHTWSFHGTDLPEGTRAWIAPLVAHSWDAQVVRFPAFERRLDTSYHSITAERLHAVVGAALAGRLRPGAEIAEVRPDAVRLAGGERLAGDLVIDGRGAPPLGGFDVRWQKFVGLELDTAAPHGMAVPVLMDATVEQHDGYRFVYVLPLGPRRLLVEDTYYSDTPEIARATLRARALAWAQSAGLEVAGIVREEAGALPIVLGGDIAAYWRGLDGGAPPSGIRAMLFHHTTGYSLPEAAALAEAVAALPELTSARVAALVRGRSLRRWREQRFFRLLNRMMFEAAEPGERYRTLQHFYRMPGPLVGRFYAGRLRGLDALRVLTGRPPVPVGRALRCMARSARGADGRGTQPVPRGGGA